MVEFSCRSILIAMVLVVFCSCGTPSKHIVNEHSDSLTRGTVVISPLDQALTFARIANNKSRHLIVVNKFSDGEIEGVDLTRALNGRLDDPITAYLEFGYVGLVKLVKDFQLTYSLKIPVDELILPVDLLDKHIAAGTNYPAHAGETGVKEGPFLFPKHVNPTGPYAQVVSQDGLLDYEVELAAVAIRPITDGKLQNEFGLILSNDFTSRATLLRNIDVSDVTSGKGFTTGKSSPGFLPVGNLFVIPKDPGQFAKSLDLKLYVNDNLRQRSSTGLMIWDFEQIVKAIWAKKEVVWNYKGKSITLMGEEPVIQARTLIMSGTPHGVLFQGISLKTKLSGIGSWLTGGWDKSIPQNVIEVYIRESEESGRYLQSKDVVSIHVNRMGTLRNQIISHSRK